MSESGGYKIFVELDFSRFNQQIQQVQNMFINAQKRIQSAVPQGAIAQAGNLSRTATSGGQQMQVMQKQASTFERIREGMANVSKNTLALIGIGTGVAAMTKLLIESSGILKSTFGLLQTNMIMFFRPIGDFIGLILRPVMMQFLHFFVIPYYQHVKPLVEKYGNIIGQGLADFLKDPEKLMVTLGTAAGGVIAPMLASRVGIPSTDAPSTPSTGPGTTPGSAAQCIELCQRTTDSLNRGISGGVLEALKVGIPAAIGGGLGFLFGQEFQRLKEDVEKMKQEMQESRKNTEQITDINAFIKQRYSEVFATVTNTAQKASNSFERTLGESIKISDSMHQASSQASKAQDSTIGIAVSLAGAAATLHQIWENAKAALSRVSGVGVVPGILPVINQAAQDAGLIPKSASASPGSGSSLVGQQVQFGSYKITVGAGLSSAVKYAKGGVITEPTALIGLRTGRMGLMAEEGPESIVPHNRPRGLGPTTIKTDVHIHGMTINSQEEARGLVDDLTSQITDKVMKALLQRSNRISIV